MIAENADMIQGAAKQVADAACVAFPPSSAILTAFTLVMTASSQVSADYDMIEGFFSIMRSLLQRLSLLENKIPVEKTFQTFLINVFSSLLYLFAKASAYCKKGRLSKRARALIEGGDSDLSSGYGRLNFNLQELESAMITQTLRTTIEISEQAKSIKQDVKTIQGQLDQHMTLTMQSLETGQQIVQNTTHISSGMQKVLLKTRDTATTGNELLRMANNISRKLDKMQSNDDRNKQRNMKSGASRSVNFDRLHDAFLKNRAEGDVAERLTDVEASYVPRVFDWIDDDPVFRRVIDNEDSLLWVSGGPGMGKSTLAFRVFRHLSGEYASDSTTCIAWFPFDEEHPEMRSIGNMFRCCAIRAAKNDPRYCQETLTALRGDGRCFTDEEAWIHLIEARYAKGSNRRLILILNGIDETNEEDFPKLVEYLSKVKSQECTVQIIFTCGPEKRDDLSTLNAPCIELTRDKIRPDMRRFALSKVKTLSRLRKIRPAARRTITHEVMRKTDCRYLHDRGQLKLSES